MMSREGRIAVGIIFIVFIGIAVGIRINLELARAHQTVAAVSCSVSSRPQVSAEVVYVYDIVGQKVLFEKNASQQMPLASLTKLMTAYVASDVLSPDKTLTITSESFAPEGDSGLRLGEKWHVKDLVDFTLITSSNDGAHTLALAVAEAERIPYESFARLMNEKAAEIGLGQTFFLNETGLDVSSSTSGAYGSAYDIATLLANIYSSHSSAFSASSEAQKTITSLSGFVHEANHTSSVPGGIAGAVVAKTGFTDLAGGNLAVIAEPLLGRPVAIVVLKASRETRDSDVRMLYDFAKSSLRRTLTCNSAL